MDISELSRQRGNKRHPWEVIRLNVIKHFISKYHPHCDHILDVGSGDAFIIKSLQRLGIGRRFTAVDKAYTPEIIDYIQQSNRTDIHFLDKLPDNVEGEADCILILDVLEHCFDDAGVLRETMQYSSANCTFILTVPAYQAFFSNHDRQLDHYRRYSVAQLENLCLKNGLILVNSGYFFFSLLLARAITVLFEKKKDRKIKRSIDNWNGGPFLTNAICVFLWIDFLLGRLLNKLSIKLPGLSAYCICRTLPS